MRVRVYHDAHLVEAQQWADAHAQPVLQALRSCAERELDQRWARNMMLNKWLEYCVERGHRFHPARSPVPACERGRAVAALLINLAQRFLKLSLRPETQSPMRMSGNIRNRAELKKAYGGLQDETFRLKDLIKQQEGATQRVQEMLNTLEGRLGSETAYSAVGSALCGRGASW
jgi:hypothetical protein